MFEIIFLQYHSKVNKQMGFFISTIREDITKLDKKLISWIQPLDKIRQYHGIFKSVCDTFIMKKTQFTQIFGSDQKSIIWNQDSINALQLFSGLIYYSSGTFKSKLKFIFLIFDFNQMKSISVIELEFMILCICNFTYKILGKYNTKADELKLAEWIGRYFDQKKRVTVTKLYRFCLECSEIIDFFNLTKITIDQTLPPNIPQKDYFTELYRKQKMNLHQSQQRELQINNKLNWFNNFYPKLNKPKQHQQNVSRPSLSWIYGIDIDKVKPCFITFEQYIFYSISSMLVTYQIQANMQRVYTHHQRAITCFCLNKDSKTIASSEGEQNCKIHIWKYDSLTTLHIIKIDHQHQISHMTFSHNYECLLTVADRQNAPILIFQTKQYTLKTSLSLTERVLEVHPFYSPLDKSEIAVALQNYFVFMSKRKIIILDEQCNQYIQQYQHTLTAFTLTYINYLQPYLRVLNNDKLRLIIVACQKNGSIVTIQFNPENCQFDCGKTQIIKLSDPCQQIMITSNALILASDNELTIYDINIVVSKQQKLNDKSPTRMIKLGQSDQIKLLSQKIEHFDFNSQQIHIITKEGDFLVVEDRSITYDKKIFNQEENYYRVNTIIKFSPPMQALCFANQTSTNLLVVSQQHKIFQLNHKTHEMTLVYEIGSQIINVIDSASSDEGVSYLICGCKSGKLLVRTDWQQIAKVYDCSSEIIDLKISSDLSSLLVATTNCLMYFQLTPNFSSPRKITFENENPISINYLDNYKFASISTSVKNVYLVELPQLKYKNILKQNQNISMTKMQMNYPTYFNQITHEQYYNKCYIGGNMKFYLITLNDGEIIFLENMEALIRKNYQIIPAHKCQISNLLITQDQKIFYSLGKTDCMLVQWTVVQQPKFTNSSSIKHRSKDSKKIKSNKLSNLQDQFNKIKHLSKQNITKICPSTNFTFYFKGTKVQKLNQSLYTSLANKMNQFGISEANLALSKRQGQLIIQIDSVYGMQCDKINQIKYLHKDSMNHEFVFLSSRFILSSKTTNSKHKIYERLNSKISYFDITEQGHIIYSEASNNPKIYINNSHIITTHKNGIIHFSLHKQYILSYAIFDQIYSINLHNYITGQLLQQRTTHLKIFQTAIIDFQTFVSINQIRIWNSMVPSDPLGTASALVLLANGKDICFGGQQGQLSVMCNTKIVQVVAHAHNSAITSMKLKRENKSFELYTGGLDETIKLWSSTFEQLLVINLSVNEFKIIKQTQNLSLEQRYPKPQNLAVKSIDCKSNKLLVGMAYGQIWQLTINKIQRQIEKQQLHSQNSITSQVDLELSQSSPLVTQNKFTYQIDKFKMIDAHCSNTPTSNQRYITFDVHQYYPIIASAANDSKLMFRNVDTNQVLANYLCEKGINIKCLRFSGGKSRMLVLALSNSVIMTFLMQFSLHMIQGIQQIKSINLKYFQKFISDQQQIYDILTVQFSPSSSYFAVSFCPFNYENKAEKDYSSYISIYRVKTQKNEHKQQAFYELKDKIKIKQDEKINYKNPKCVRQLSIIEYCDKNYLIFCEQTFNDQPNSKYLYQVYSIEQRSILSDQFSINWSNANFSHLINLKITNMQGEEQIQDPITYMIRHQDYYIYGTNDGRIHLVKMESLMTEQPIQQCKVNQMCLSRVYNSLISKIKQIKLSYHKKYMFVAAEIDQCIAKYNIVREDAQMFLEYQPYQLQLDDSQLHGQYLDKNSFYSLVNNQQPLRQEITNILEDVQTQVNPSINLSMTRVFGRRAKDRRYNLTYFQGNALYSLGPNIVIQNIRTDQKESSSDPQQSHKSLRLAQQELLPADPSPSSHKPQISTFHYSNSLLIVATEQQKSKLFVWDIKSKSCLSCIEVQCSFIYNIKFSGDEHAIYYGINDQFQLVVSIINWRLKKTIGFIKMPYSGNWIIRDQTLVNYKNDYLEFVTCGYMHLCYWEIRTDALVYHNFNSINDIQYFCVKSYQSFLITGCELGNLQLWNRFQLIHKIKGHHAVVRCLEIDYVKELVISGGKDGRILIMKIEKDNQNKFELKIISQTNLANQDQSNIQQQQSSSHSSEIKTYKIQHQIQALSSNPNPNSQSSLLVGTRSGNIYKLLYNAQSIEDCKLQFQNHDYQTIVSVTFSKFYAESFFTLTNAGLIERWSIKSLTKDITFDLAQQAVQIEACQQYLLVCCKSEILVYKVDGSTKFQKQDEYCIQITIADYQSSDQRECIITKFCLSKNQRDIAVCVKISSKDPIYVINLYEFGKKNHIFQLNNLKHQIDYLDFNDDQKYLLFKDAYEEIGMIHLEKDYKRINTIFVQMNIEWEKQGLRISPHAQKIYYSYNSQNKITAICRLGKTKIIVGDQMGTVRIFDYPPSQDKIGQLHIQCYTAHMNQISNIKVHPKLNFVLTTALEDRSLILWSVQHLQDQISQEKQEQQKQ